MDRGDTVSRYARQMVLPQVGVAGQAHLSAARVLVIGAGGLAAPVLPLLAGAGVGHLTIVDGDTVALSNLHRQTLFSEGDCGQPKAQIAAQRCRALNSDIAAIAKKQTLTSENAAELITQADVVLDCADSYAATYTLSDTCLALGKPLISASVLGMGGYVGGFCGGAPSVRAVFPEAPESGASCATAGVLGPVVGLVGAMQAQMTLAVLLGLDPSPLGQMVQFDAQSYRSIAFRFDGALEPDQALFFVAPSELTDSDFIVELRSVDEIPEPILPSANRIPPDEVLNHLPDPGKRIALCCATGLRAWCTAERIQQNWSGEIVLVAAATS
jgi:sulfur-carrier protein adenylyltransferase/sulfurtransferase